MKLDLFLSKTSNLFAERRVLRLMVILIGGLTALNSLLLFVVMDRQRTVLVPPGLTSQAEVSGSTADATYLRLMGRYITALRLNYTPATVRKQFDELLPFVAPEKYPYIQKELYQTADTVEMAGATSVFHLGDITHYPQQQSLEMPGQQELYVRDQKTEDRRVVYRLSYEIRDGRFWVVDFSEKEG
jgi:conjugal transfer pilus assembly protein TraE